MATLSKGCKPDNFKSHNSLKFSFTNIRDLRSNFVDCESFLESNSPDILALCETNLDDSIDSCNFSVRGTPKGFYYSYEWSCGLCEGRTSFCKVFITRKLCRFLCFRLDLLHSVSYFFFLYQSPSSSSCTF